MTVAFYLLLTIGLFVVAYTVRHYVFTFNRAFAEQRYPYATIEDGQWPSVTVFVPAHNEELVIAHCLDALLRADYPADRLRVVPLNDRSKDNTKAIIDDYVARYPGRFFPIHRTGGTPGKSAALAEACEGLESEVFLVFDADYIPGRMLVKQLVAPFFDPEVGSVMGRVVPMNAGANLLTRLLDLERSGGYQVDQQARMNMRLITQYGGTAGGMRTAALEEAGGWNPHTLTEDTDACCRLLLTGWKVAYLNYCECYEEVPEVWRVRVKQIGRWAQGHMQASFEFPFPFVDSRVLSRREKFDGLLFLGVYSMAPVILIGWIVALALFFHGQFAMEGFVALLAIASYSSLGNFAAFFEIAAAARLDGSRRRIRLLPLNAFGFLVSLIAVTKAAWKQAKVAVVGGELVWDKTQRFRAAKQPSS
ncbi:MAG: glycosyltransferase family 2 protein [Bacteroidota bacterium]